MVALAGLFVLWGLLFLGNAMEKGMQAIASSVKDELGPDWKELVRGLIRSTPGGPCWCEYGIGNPMQRGHSAACAALRKVWT